LRRLVFDVVVVGGGTAGCVVAARLAESGSRSVLLLEAGPDRRADPPDEMRDGWRITRDFDWGYTSEPDARGMVQNVRRTRLLGGTSWTTRFTPRGSPGDYDSWAARGNAGWDFENVLPYFVRLETDAEFGDQPWHGDCGPIPSTRYEEFGLTEVGAASLEALQASGFPAVEDHNRPGAVGVGRMPMNSRNGTRVTTADAYLAAGSTPTNLTIRADAPVSNVLLDGDRAHGVCLADGTVIGAGWVVLCAGTFGSPATLLRSGIGPVEHLRSLGAPAKIDLPGVGANLADHAGIDVEFGDYQGGARESPILHLIATFHSSTRAHDEPPDLMLWVSDPEGQPASFEIAVVLAKPHSRGSVRLRSMDPADQPAIDLPGVRDPFDIARLAEGYRRAYDVACRPEIRRFCSRPRSPEPSAPELADFIRTESYSIPHVVGTCSMGARPEDGAVVDTSGRVHGMEALSIVDASIMPDVPSGFTHIPTIMIAERLSDHLAVQL
jgi:choline dehydrogenase